jgi:hypothetical protein
MNRNIHLEVHLLLGSVVGFTCQFLENGKLLFLKTVMIDECFGTFVVSKIDVRFVQILCVDRF